MTKRCTLTVAAIAALLAATALFTKTQSQAPRFTFQWANHYDADASNELTLVISNTNLLTPVSEWDVIGATRDGRFSIPETNACRFFSVINCDSNTMRFSALPE